MFQCSVTAICTHPIEYVCHQIPGWCWVVRNEGVTDSLFVFPVTGILGVDLDQLRAWYVCIDTKHLPLLILQTVQYSGEVVWSETGLWEHTGERDGEISTHCTLHVHNMYYRNAILFCIGKISFRLSLLYTCRNMYINILYMYNMLRGKSTHVALLSLAQYYPMQTL